MHLRWGPLDIVVVVVVSAKAKKEKCESKHRMMSN
jgi:hypothetical protein